MQDNFRRALGNALSTAQKAEQQRVQAQIKSNMDFLHQTVQELTNCIGRLKVMEEKLRKEFYNPTQISVLPELLQHESIVILAEHWSPPTEGLDACLVLKPSEQPSADLVVESHKITFDVKFKQKVFFYGVSPLQHEFDNPLEMLPGALKSLSFGVSYISKAVSESSWLERLDEKLTEFESGKVPAHAVVLRLCQ